MSRCCALLFLACVSGCALQPLAIPVTDAEEQEADVADAAATAASDAGDGIAVEDSGVSDATETPACPEVCSAWKTCEAGACVAKPCTTDTDCNAKPLPEGVDPHYCFHGKCAAFQCQTEKECPLGNKCDGTFHCYVPPTGCTWDGMCEDADKCTYDECDTATGACKHKKSPGCCAAAAECDDKQACTIDSCTAGYCDHVGKADCCQSASDCGDGNPCTQDVCTSGKCSFTKVAACCLSDGACDDDDPSSLDQCWQQACLHTWPGVPATCANDAECKGNACLTGACKTGKCSYAKTGSCCSADAACAKNVKCQVDSCTAGVCASTPALGKGTHVWSHFDAPALDGWVLTGNNKIAVFHQTSMASIAGGGALRFGVPGVVSYDSKIVATASATGPTFIVPKPLAGLQFWVYIDVEPGTAVDDCGVDLVVAGSAKPLWSKAKDLKGSTTAQAWKLMTVDLSPWAGQSAQLKVWFDQKVQSGASKAKLGVVFDEVAVQGACP